VGIPVFGRRHKTLEASKPALDEFSLSYRFPDELSWMA
jgi:hypothetical protein